jgi:hypothetical protein
MAAGETGGRRTDTHRRGCDRAYMTKHRKRKTLDLFIDALVHPVRFR